MPELFAQAFARGGIIACRTLPRNIAALGGGLVENVVGRLNQSRAFKFAQKIAGADQADPLIDHGAALPDIAVFEQEQGLRGKIAPQKSFHRFYRGLFAKATNGAAFLQAALLVNARIGRDDPHHVEMAVDPFNDLLGSGRATHAGRLDRHGVGNA